MTVGIFAPITSIVQRIVKRSPKTATELPLLIPAEEQALVKIKSNYQEIPDREKTRNVQLEQLQATPLLEYTFKLTDYFEAEQGRPISEARVLGKGNYGQAILYRFKKYNT